MEISAVSSVDNPDVGDTIEVSINITGGSNVAGYGFKLTFDPTELEYISIENADYLPPNAFVPVPRVESGAVGFDAAALGGTGEGDGTLAVATFRVLAKTETTIGLEDVTIGDIAGQPLAIASVTGTTINSTNSGAPTTPDPPTTPETPTTPSENVLVTGVRVSAVSNVDNPAVGATIEVSINITGASNVAGYDFTLTFDPTKLEFVSIENADYLSAGAFTVSPIVGNGSVKFAAAALSGTGKGDGILAIATFKALADTETTVRFAHVEIGDQMGQPLVIAAVIGATINRAAPIVGAEIEYLLSIPAGTNLIHVPLKVTAVRGIARTIISIGDLYDALGGASTVNFLITYDPHAQEWRSYFSAADKRGPADARLTDDKGVIANLKTFVSVRLTGSALGETGSGTITLTPGLNVVGLPLDDSRITRVSDLFALNGIGGNVPVIILTDNGEFKTVGRAGDPGDIQITGGQSFILSAQRPATVIIYGNGWTNIR